MQAEKSTELNRLVAEWQKAATDVERNSLYSSILSILDGEIRYSIYRYLRRDYESEDCYQSCSIRLLVILPTFDFTKGNSFVAYAVASFRHVCLSHQRTADRNASRFRSISTLEKEEAEEPFFAEQPTPLPSTLDNVSSNEFADEVHKLIELLKTRLSEAEKRVLLRYAKGGMYEEIAADLGIKKKDVDNALQRIKVKASRLPLESYKGIQEHLDEM